MSDVFPLVLIAIGGAALVALRDTRGVLGGLVLQWLGLIWIGAQVAASAGSFLGVGQLTVIEGVTALVCLAILGITMRNLTGVRAEQLPGLDEFQKATLRRAEERARRAPRPRPGFADQLWVWVLVLAAGAAGYALAHVYSPGANELALTAFYWIALSGVLVLVLEGARNPLKLAVGLLALLNAAVLLVNVLGMPAPSQVVLGLMSAGRIALTALLAYGMTLLKLAFLDLDLGALFDMRGGTRVIETALVVRDQGDSSSPMVLAKRPEGREPA
jgi:hypothetical protein